MNKDYCNIPVKIAIEDIEVEGRIIYCSESDIEVEITKPYQYLSSSMHIPTFARIMGSYKDQDGIHTDKCFETAKELLKELYKGADEYYPKIEILREKLAYTKKIINNISRFSVNDKEYKIMKERLDYIRRFNCNITTTETDFNYRMNNFEYRKILVDIDEKNSYYHDVVNYVMEAFYKDAIPNIPSCEARKKMVDVIEGKKDLLSEKNNLE
jgi:hypothetical protein